MCIVCVGEGGVILGITPHPISLEMGEGGGRMILGIHPPRTPEGGGGGMGTALVPPSHARPKRGT